MLAFFRRDEEGRKLEVELAVEERPKGKSPVATVEAEYMERGDTSSADRHWNRSRSYHITLGADVASRVFIGPAKGKPGNIHVQDTIFGFAYFGEGVVTREDV